MQIPYTPRKIQVVVYTTFLNFRPRCLDTLGLFRILGLVVFGELNYLAISTEGGPRVPCICYDYLVSYDHDNVGGASD